MPERKRVPNRRVGRFLISSTLLVYATGHTDIESAFGTKELEAVFKDVIALEIQYRSYQDVTKYLAYHPKFRELSEGEIPPWYECLITRLSDTIKVEWIEITGNYDPIW